MVDSTQDSDFDLNFDHAFRSEAGRILEAGATRSLLLTGNVQDFFYVSPTAGSERPNGEYVGLTDFLCKRWGKKSSSTMLVVYELNGAIRFKNPIDRDRVKGAWPDLSIINQDPESAFQSFLSTGLNGLTTRTKKSETLHPFDHWMSRAVGKPAVALQLLKKFCELSRDAKFGSPLFGKKFLILIEWAHMIIPDGEVSRLNEADRHRVMIFQNWFSDMTFMHGEDSVILITESRNRINKEVASMSQMLEVTIPSPDTETRRHFIEWFDKLDPKDLLLWGSKTDLARMSAGLNLQALHQMLTTSSHEKRSLTIQDVEKHIEAYIVSKLGEGRIEFLRPTHTLKDVIGHRKMKAFLDRELRPGMIATDPDEALVSVIVAGAVGVGKTFIMEALPGELGIPVIRINASSLRSMYVGQADVQQEAIERYVLEPFEKLVVNMDEADTLLGGLGRDVHETERRTTGRVQGWISNPKYRGKIFWMLMTARPHLLPADMRRPGRGGDNIVGMSDPIDEDFQDVLKWMLEPVVKRMPTGAPREEIESITKGYSMAAFQALRRKLKILKKRKKGKINIQEIVEYIKHQRLPNIGLEREYQMLQGFRNTTDTTVLPYDDVTEELRLEWDQRIRELETLGIR